jgi:spermidine dehydrogenase
MPKRRLPTDTALGMDRAIDRRDFLQGAAISVGGVAFAAGAWPQHALAELAPAAQPASQEAQGYYPPVRTGMRGAHPGSFEGAHAVRDGKATPPPLSTGESYDLVVVGGGLSGLSAAYFWRQAKPNARILILDNHDDFGGHAKRNEFNVDGKMLLVNGGTLLIDSPRPYSPVADGLMKGLGIDPEALSKIGGRQDTFSKFGLRNAVFYDQPTFGADKLVVSAPNGRRGKPDPEALARSLAEAPLSAAVKADIVRVETGHDDYLPGLSLDQKMDRLSRISYRDFLLTIAKVDPGVIPYYQTRTHGEWGIGIDGEPALDCWGLGLPGFQGLGLDRSKTTRMGYTAAGYSSTGGSYRYHFPDGNASIARLLVRRLIPAVAPGSTAEDIVLAKFDYAALDRPDAAARIRLNSIALRARNLPSGGVEVVYERAGATHSVEGRACIMAGYNMMIPYIVPDLPAVQKAALHQLVKVPLVYTSVAIRNWRAFQTLGISGATCPGSYFSSFRLAEPQAIGGYQTAANPDEPIVVQLTRTPCLPGAPTECDQHRAGRVELINTPFEVFERHIRDQLGRVLGPGGFDPARHIAGIMVNRWPHGYAYEYNPLYDPWDVPESERPHVVGRQRFGRIAIANSDSGAAAYTSSAIDQAYRAVGELLSA